MDKVQCLNLFIVINTTNTTFLKIPFLEYRKIAERKQIFKSDALITICDARNCKHFQKSVKYSIEHTRAIGKT